MTVWCARERDQGTKDTDKFLESKKYLELY